jgi:hypothetical protein
MITIAHHEEGGVRADGDASLPLSEFAAASLPAGAACVDFYVTRPKTALPLSGALASTAEQRKFVRDVRILSRARMSRVHPHGP